MSRSWLRCRAYLQMPRRSIKSIRIPLKNLPASQRIARRFTHSSSPIPHPRTSVSNWRICSTESIQCSLFYLKRVVQHLSVFHAGTFRATNTTSEVGVQEI